MGNITVKFVGKEYSIPEDVLTYIELLDFTNNIQKQLTNSFVRKLRNELDKGNVGCLDDEIMAPDIEQQTGKFIAKLTEHGIFDRTINDYLCKNEGYKLISKVNASSLAEAKRALNQQMSDWLQGYEDAVQKKDASVTGLGFSIWSGSFVNHAIYAAMEASKVNAQEKAAAKEYQRDMAELDARLESRKSEDEKRYISNTYIPHMEAAITVFAYELLDTYISDLIKNGKMDENTLKYINIDRSNDLLKNLTLSSNKEEILYRAFEACPYNLQVYSRALNYGLLDYESYKTAEYFKQGKNIIFSLVSNLGDVEYPKKFKINYDSAEKMAEFTQSDVVTILQAKTKEYVSALIKAYQSAFELIANKEQCYKIIRGLSEKNLLAGEVISRGTAQAQVNSIVTDSIWNQLVNKCGYLDLLEKIKAFLPADVHLQSKSEIDDFLIGKITVNFEESRQDIIKKINLKREEDEKNRIEEEKRKAAAVDLRKKRTKQVIRIGCIAVLIALILLLVSALINSHMQKREEERIYQEKISTIENQVNNGEYEEAVNSLIYSDLSEEQKQEYYNSLVDRIQYKSFDVNGLVINIPEHWYIENYSDPYIRSARDSDEDSLLTWYVKCMGSIDQVVRDGDDGWRRNNDYSSTTVVGCEEAYIRRELSKKVDVDEIYSVIDYYVVCQGLVYKIQYFAYDERFFEPEMQMLLNHVEFERFADAEIQANRKEEAYVNATNLLEDGEYEEAIALFEQLGDYKDSKELIDTAISLQLQQVENYKSSCTEIVYVDDLNYVSSIDVKVYAQVKSHIRNAEYYIITENGETIQIWNNSSREELIEGEWITIYGNAYGHGDNMTIRVEYIDE